MIILIGIGLVVFLFWGAFLSNNPLVSVLCIVGIFVVILGGMVLNDSVCSIETSRTTNLYAGHNDSEIQGSFMLGSGTIEKIDYVYYWVDNGGIKSKHKVTMSSSVFIEDGKNIIISKLERKV